MKKKLNDRTIKNSVNGITERAKIVGGLIRFFWRQKLWWMIPMLIVFLVVGVLILFIGSSPLAPILYPLF